MTSATAVIIPAQDVKAPSDIFEPLDFLSNTLRGAVSDHTRATADLQFQGLLSHHDQPTKPESHAISSSVAEFSSPQTKFLRHGTLVIFDWDDTLLPSSWISFRGLSIDDESLVEDDDHCILRCIADQVRQVLQLACSYGEVVIITNAEEGWVEMSATKFLPGVVDVIEQCSIQIVSARSLFESVERSSPFSWKAKAFSDIVTLWLYGCVRGQRVDSHFTPLQPSEACLLERSPSTFAKDDAAQVFKISAELSRNFCERRKSKEAVPRRRAVSVSVPCVADPQPPLIRSRSFGGIVSLSKSERGCINPIVRSITNPKSNWPSYPTTKKTSDKTVQMWSNAVVCRNLAYEDMGVWPDVKQGFHTLQSFSTCSSLGDDELPTPFPSENRTILSFGDSEAERTALLETCRYVPGLRYKSFKFCEAPSPSALFQELRLIVTSIESLVQHDGILDLKVNWSCSKDSPEGLMSSE